MNCVAQHSDAGLWISINAEKKVTRAFSISLSEELRMADNISSPGTCFSEVGLNYRLNRNFRVSATYRFMLKERNDGTYSNRHRIYFDLVYRERLKPLTILLRTRFQSQYADVYSSPEGKYAQYYSRNKLTLKYEISSRLRPYLSAELFTPLNAGSGCIIDNARYSGGSEYSLNRAHTIDLFYMIQHEYNVGDPETDHIIGIGYYYTF